MHILVVDDDPFIQQLIGIHLKSEGYSASFASDGAEALRKSNEQNIRLAIVDVMMPKMNGIQLTKQLAQKNIPVLMLTAKSELADKEQGFLAGADDYMVKPFEPKELLFRVKAIIRRFTKTETDIIQVGNMIIDRTSFEVKIGQNVLLLPLKEFELLNTLCMKVSHALTREYLMSTVWGYDYSGDDYTLTTHIKRLRQRLQHIKADVQIVTVRGIGYKIEEM